jgi:hypothetical protein
MIVKRDINTSLQCYNGWIHRIVVDPEEAKKPINREGLDFNPTYGPTIPKKPYPATSGLSAASVTADVITGIASLS